MRVTAPRGRASRKEVVLHRCLDTTTFRRRIERLAINPTRRRCGLFLADRLPDLVASRTARYRSRFLGGGISVRESSRKLIERPIRSEGHTSELQSLYHLL